MRNALFRHGGLLFLALLFGASLQAQRGNPELAYAGETVDRMIADFMRENEIAGLSLAIVQAPYVTRVAGYGVADARNGLLVSSNTLFDLGQLSHAYLAVAVMQLVEAGKLALSDPLEKHLSGLPAALQAWTVVEAIRQATPAGKEAGAVLARLVEKASGEACERYIRVNQFERLGLGHTFFAGELAGLKRETLSAGRKHAGFLQDPSLINPTEPAIGYRRGAGGVQALPVNPALAVYASSLDVSLWDIGLAGDILIKDPALRAQLYQPPLLANGTVSATSGPWFFPGRKGLMIANGSGDGFSSLLSRYTAADELLCVTLLANREGVDLAPLARRIAGAYDARLAATGGESK